MEPYPDDSPISIDDKNLSSFNGGSDRISGLPEPILHQILSLVDLKQAVQTSVLSTRWRYVWKSLPILNLINDLDSFWFKEFVDNVLNLRDNSCNIQRFFLHCYSFDISFNVYQWILTSVSCNVQELYLHIGFDREFSESFRLPLNLFTLNSLTIFHFRSPCYLLKLDLPDSMNLPNLKTLVLDHVLLDGDEMLNKIFSSCPVLESFTIRDTDFCQMGLTHITAPQLLHLVIEDCYNSKYGSTSLLSNKSRHSYNVKLYAPNLISLRVKGFISTECAIENFSALVKAEIAVKVISICFKDQGMVTKWMKQRYAPWMMKFLKGIQNVKTLTLEDRFLEVVSGVPALLKSTPIQFHNLRSLKLGTSNSRKCVRAMTYLLDISPNLESLFLEIKAFAYKSADKGDYWNEEMPLQCILYHLKFVEITCVQGSFEEFMFLEILLKNAMVLKKLVLSISKNFCRYRWGSQLFSKRNCWRSEFTQKVLNFPRASSSVEIVFSNPSEID